MLRVGRIKEIIRDISITAVLVDHSGTIIEMAEDWKTQSEKWTNDPNISVGKNYFEYCIRPDRHSIEIMRGFKDLLARKVDFFSTIYWMEKNDRKQWFLIAASPQAPSAPTTVVVHIDINPILHENTQLSALMLGLGAAASAQVEASITNTIKSVLSETFANPRTITPMKMDDPSIGEQKLLGKLTKSQIHILSCLADGLSNNEIAKARGLSVNTVKEQVSIVIEKLGVSNRTQAALFAARNNVGMLLDE